MTSKAPLLARLTWIDYLSCCSRANSNDSNPEGRDKVMLKLFRAVHCTFNLGQIGLKTLIKHKISAKLKITKKYYRHIAYLPFTPSTTSQQGCAFLWEPHHGL